MPGSIALSHRAAAQAQARGTTEPWIVRWLLIGTALAFLGLFLVLPLAAVFAQALEKGIEAYLLAVREPTANLALSNAVRPGVVGWAKTMATELGPKGITVNSIGPGRIDTDRMKEVYPDGPTEADVAMIPLRRFGRPEEAAAVVCFLASERASYLTGTLIPVDGGLGRALY